MRLVVYCWCCLALLAYSLFLRWCSFQKFIDLSDYYYQLFEKSLERVLGFFLINFFHNRLKRLSFPSEMGFSLNEPIFYVYFAQKLLKRAS